MLNDKIEFYGEMLSMRAIALKIGVSRDTLQKHFDKFQDIYEAEKICRKIIEEKKGNLIITADHGNADQMIDYKTGEPHTAHTTNPVPIILVTDNKEYKLKENGKLADLAPTMLDLMGIEKPEEMTGESLIEK